MDLIQAANSATQQVSGFSSFTETGFRRLILCKIVLQRLMGEIENKKRRVTEKVEAVSLEVHQTTALYTFDVSVGDQKVADIRENTENDTISHWISGFYDHVPPKRAFGYSTGRGAGYIHES